MSRENAPKAGNPCDAMAVKVLHLQGEARPVLQYENQSPGLSHCGNAPLMIVCGVLWVEPGNLLVNFGHVQM